MSTCAERTDVRCCCNPSNLIGSVPTQVGLNAGLVVRELEQGGSAFDSNDNEELIRLMPDFEPPVEVQGATKTWKKTWKK